MSKTSLWRHLLLDAIIPPSLSESIFTPFQSVTKPPASSIIGIVAAIFSTSIARDDGLANAMEQKAERLMAKARTLDSQQQTTRKLVTNRFKTERLS